MPSRTTVLGIIGKTIATGAVLLATTPAFASHYHHGPTAGKSHKSKHGKPVAHATSTRPRAMDDARATEIQTSLVKAGYLPSVSGHWDEASAEAMRKLQADNGWQTKLIPDSRALIKLGLGPGSDAQTAVPATSGSAASGDSTSAGTGSHAELAHSQ